MGIGAQDFSGVAVVGRACRLPGAPSVQALWDLLTSGRCAVSVIPDQRWSKERWSHPNRGERGKSYTWAAGILDDIWSFDPAPFGLSPREAEQMDPQQRLLLELTWEALEDAGIPPSALAGSHTGVFVGASSLDYGNLRLFDMSGADPYFMTGNTLSIISNRLSYIFDLHGPSYTIDTACSSSLVALNEAIEALRSGRVETAIVAGVNILASPHSFVGFCQAGMLSPKGLCQAFADGADGYVRAEGGVVLVLRSAEAAARNGDRVHARLLASGLNSDGRTNGISLPAKDHQITLLQTIYGRLGVERNRIAFVEAHGTGTRVGDPIEATAIGMVLGQGRSRPLPIGSIKTNIGHTEPVSGLAGVLKAMLSLEHDVFPPTLHCSEPNPEIAFADLNLDVATEARPLSRGAEPRLAGVNSFGFGGTNAHVVVADPLERSGATVAVPAEPPRVLVVSAQTRAALAALVGEYTARIGAASSDAEAQAIIAAANHQRERLAYRVVAPAENIQALVSTLTTLAADLDTPTEATVDRAVEREASVAFVFSGNGSQWPGMGRQAYRSSPAFRESFDRIDAAFSKLAGWSLADGMNAEDLAGRLARTSLAQPLIFAIQVASAAALAADGLTPSLVLGHSVGEVAAAHVSGALSLDAAVRTIYFRSLHQELTENTGTMAVLFGSRETADRLVELIDGLEIAAFNSPRSFTVAGSTTAIEQASKLARQFNGRTRSLDLPYPFHTRLMAPVEAPLASDLRGLAAQETQVPFVSTVTGKPIDGRELGADYWWRNIREPIHFMQAVQEAMGLGARIFMEIGPSPSLLSHINDSAEQAGVQVAALGVLDRRDRPSDPFRRAAQAALARGAAIENEATLGTHGVFVEGLPSYPFERQSFRIASTIETSGLLEPGSWHPLIGRRLSADSLEWRCHVDTMLLPELSGHRVEGHVLFPGTGFLEMAWAVARDWTGQDNATVGDFEIVQPMQLVEGVTREVLIRVSASASTLEITSRARLRHAPWQIHAIAKIVQHQPAETDTLNRPRALRHMATAEQIYAAARGVGLDYQGAFRQLDRAYRPREDRIWIDLNDAAGDPRFGMDPARLDCCFHGMVLLFAGDASRRSATPYIPVRIGEARLLAAGTPRHAEIRVKRQNERVIVADFTVTDADGTVLARLHDARFRAMPARREGRLESLSVVPVTAMADVPGFGQGEADRLRSLFEGAVPDAEPALSADAVLLEGWATAVAFRLARGLARDGRIDVAALIDGDRLPESRRSWFLSLLFALERAGLATTGDEGWTLAHDVELPAPERILRGLSEEHPRRSAELVLAARVTALARDLAADRAGAGEDSLPASAVDAVELGGVSAVALAERAARILAQSLEGLPRDRALRLLQLGHGPLTAPMSRVAQSLQARHVVLEPHSRRLERGKLWVGEAGDISFVAQIEAEDDNTFDLVVSGGGLHRLVSHGFRLTEINRFLAPNGMLAAFEPEPSTFADLVFGLDATWFSGSATADFPVGARLHAAEWVSALTDAGLHAPAVRSVETSAESGLLILAQGGNARHAPAIGSITIVTDDQDANSALASSLATLLASAGHHVSVDFEGSAEDAKPIVAGTTVIHLAGAFSHFTDSAERIVQRSFSLKRCAERIGGHPANLWFVSPDATASRGGPAASAEAGLWSFARTLANEFPQITVRRLDVPARMAQSQLAERMCNLVLSGTTETELVLRDDAVEAVRMTPLRRLPESGAPTEAATLAKSDAAGLDRLVWSTAARVAPGAGEVEIAVEATGLNFRDVMWNLSLLPDEILEDGFAGPSMGLECAGRIVRVGEGVKNLAVGDPVIAFAPAAFSTHVTVPGEVVARAPEGLPIEAAATIPVAFLTAYYGLMTCAQLKRGEWVLIHGGAGGVGLAALQIARWRGAKIIATAGSPEKRELLKMLGAAHVFDSRSTSFVDDIRRAVAQGVDVVLNSLSGEAMERSIAVLRPFGRFVELGKRDYVANTHIGLRPFRRNLSYFGVDLDQLLANDRAISRKLFRQVMRLFEAGHLSPLPYRCFDAADVVEAFRLMQQSGHVGKILVRPPVPGSVPARVEAAFKVSETGTHLITGGFGGFGGEAALWLADHGARYIVLVGRRGAESAEAQQLVAELDRRGVQVRAEACDISDGRQVEAMLTRIDQLMPPLAGVIHAAMVLEDAMIANLEPASMARVLAPKIAGAEHLHRSTRERKLDYFVLFSSATTLLGNPGQASYVAANSYMESLARRRVRDGLPALCIAWGAIEDKGVLARKAAVMELLAGRVGVKPLPARRALDLMGQALARPSRGPDEAVMAIAPVDWGKARGHLKVMNSPTYAALGDEGQASEGGDVARIDVAALLAEKDAEIVRKEIADVIVTHVARILRVPKEDVAPGRALLEIGLDSLMAVELAASLQEIFGLEAPLSGSASSLTALEIADHIIAAVGSDTTKDQAMALGMAERHLSSEVDTGDLRRYAEDLQIIPGAVEETSK